VRAALVSCVSLPRVSCERRGVPANGDSARMHGEWSEGSRRATSAILAVRSALPLKSARDSTRGSNTPLTLCALSSCVIVRATEGSGGRRGGERGGVEMCLVS